MSEIDRDARHRHREDGAVCRPCAALSPLWRLETPVTAIPPASNAFELIEGLVAEVANLVRLAGSARVLLGQCDPGGVEAAHARGFVDKAMSEVRHFDGERRKWRSWVDVHPDLASLPITARCAHLVDRGYPSCWDPDTMTYRGESSSLELAAEPPLAPPRGHWSDDWESA